MELLKENVEIILPEEGLDRKLAQAKTENRKLIIKLGFDPTAPDLHLGHAIVLKKLRQFQEQGHQIVIVIGSFTARIGDPTGKNKSRPPLSKEKIALHAQTYVNQLSKILDTDRCQIIYNSEWLETLSAQDMIQLLSKVTLAQIMHRADFSNRFQENIPISIHELLYPVLQGWDSVQIQADIEMGGTDQLFNCTMGRQLQESEGLSPQVVLCMPLLKGTDGNDKMSKSLNNTIGLTDEPEEMYGKVMSIPDSLLFEYMNWTTDFEAPTKKNWRRKIEEGENPIQLKKAIAYNIVNQYHGKKYAEKAQEYFEVQFQNKSFTNKNFVKIKWSDMKVEDEVTLLNLCRELQKEESNSQIRRLIEGGGVMVNDQKITDVHWAIKKKPIRIKLGKRNYFELE